MNSQEPLDPAAGSDAGQRPDQPPPPPGYRPSAGRHQYHPPQNPQQPFPPGPPPDPPYPPAYDARRPSPSGGQSAQPYQEPQYPGQRAQPPHSPVSQQPVQHYPAQYTGQQNPAPQYPVQQYPVQQNHGQPYPGQQYSGQQNPAQQYPGPQYQGRPYPGQQYPGPQNPAQQYSAQQYPAQQGYPPRQSAPPPAGWSAPVGPQPVPPSPVPETGSAAQLTTDPSGPGRATRRAVIAGAGVAVVAGAAGFAWFRLAKPTTTAPTSGYAASGGTAAPTSLATVAQIPEGGGVVLADQKLVVTREKGDKVHCFSAVCTHQGCLVNQVAGGKITCPCHGSAFDATTGAVVAGPAPSPLPAVPVTVVNGTIYTG